MSRPGGAGSAARGSTGPTVGLLFPLSGPAAVTGRECVNGARVALSAAGVRVVEADVMDGDAAAVARALVETEHASAVIGTLFTALAIPASAAACEAGALYIEVAAVADELGQRHLARFVRSGPRSAAFGERAVSFVREELAAVGLSSAGPAVALEDSPFGRSLADAVIRELRAGGAGAVEEIPISSGSAAIDDAIERLRRLRPDILFAACYTGMAQALWRGIGAAGIHPRATIGVGGGWLHLGEGEGAPDPEGVFVVDVAPSSALAAAGLTEGARRQRSDHASAYRRATGSDPTVYSDLAYVGAALLATALNEAGSADPDEVAAALRRIDLGDGETILGFGARFDGAGENLRAAPVVMQWRADRTLPVVYPRRLATASPILPR